VTDRTERRDDAMKVTLLMAITLDGKIGKTPDHFPDWTGPEDKKLFVSITRRAGAVIMGSKTYDTIRMPLPGRKNVVLTRDKSRVSDWENLWFTDESPQAVLDALEREGYQEAILAGGALINSLFAEAGLIDDIIVTISPTIFGHGLSLFTQEISMDLKLMDLRRLGANLVCLTYHVVK
jgi:dihydrofolate reductase